MIERKLCFVKVVLVAFSPTLLRGSLQCRKHRHFSHAVNALSHAKEGVRVAYSDGVPLLVVYAKAKRTVFLWGEYGLCCPFCSRQLCNVFSDPSANLKRGQLLSISRFRYEAE